MIRLPKPRLPDPRPLLRLAHRPLPFFVQRRLVEPLLNRAFAGPWRKMPSSCWKSTASDWI
ncbi:hypothetical protein [Marinobacterium aestuariivivens]|uniref:Uncharacterized protein n=1 Tax=Marinobacterium aestuariivivens TaxID=1698799 RepID=A0ABW2A3K9_9GAMM